MTSQTVYGVSLLCILKADATLAYIQFTFHYQDFLKSTSYGCNVQSWVLLSLRKESFCYEYETIFWKLKNSGQLGNLAHAFGNRRQYFMCYGWGKVVVPVAVSLQQKSVIASQDFLPSVVPINVLILVHVELQVKMCSGDCEVLV